MPAADSAQSAMTGCAGGLLTDPKRSRVLAATPASARAPHSGHEPITTGTYHAQLRPPPELADLCPRAAPTPESAEPKIIGDGVPIKPE